VRDSLADFIEVAGKMGGGHRVFESR